MCIITQVVVTCDVHVTLLELDSMILFKMNGLKCVWKIIC